MAHKESFALPLAVLLLSCLGSAIPAAAQAPASRLAGDWRSAALLAVPASKPPVPFLAVDEGAAPQGMQLERMLLLLQPTATQQQALTAELAGLQDTHSPQYHQWLTPSAYAAAYANAPADVNAIAAWLSSAGFQVAPLPAGLGWIEFSGTVVQVESAFQAQIDTVTVGGTMRPMLTSAISVPAPFQPLVQGLVSLDGALSSPALTAPLTLNTPAAALAAENAPEMAEALTPRLAGQLLHWDALHASGVQGAGQTIAIAARSNLLLSDVAAFRSTFGLPAGVLSVLPNGTDPGLTSDEAAAVMAASWTGAAAPGAQIVVAPAATTAATDGIDLSLAAIVDQHLAATVALGYTVCEASLGAAHQAFYAALYQQAAAEGMAIVAASGDSGAAACQVGVGSGTVSSGYGVNAMASTPWNTAVSTASFGAAGVAGGIGGLSAWAPSSATEPALASGGGSSLLYDAPSWQAAASTTAASTSSFSPAARQQMQHAYKSWLGQAKGATSAAASAATMTSGFRLLPDLALPTAIDAGVNPGLAFCLSGNTGATGCTLVRSGGSAAAAALFAGIAALVEQKNGAQGNLNPALYALNQSTGVYADVTQGSAQLTCAAGSSGCGAAQQIGFTAAAGYDLTTGLGAVNAQALVNDWAQPLAGSNVNDTITWSTTLTAQTLPVILSSSSILTLDATVTATDPTIPQPPLNYVSFVDSISTDGSTTFSTKTYQDNSPLNSGQNGSGYYYAEFAVPVQTGTLAAGVYHSFEAVYSGDSVYYDGPISTATPITAILPAATQVNWTTPSQTISSSTALSLAATVGPSSAFIGSVPSGVTPSGSVKIEDAAQGYALLGATQLTNGAFTLQLQSGALSTAATHILQACYLGTTAFLASCDANDIAITIPAAASISWRTALPATMVSGATTTLAVNVLSADPTVSGPPTGTVTFTDNGSPLGAAQTLNAGSATLTVSAGQTALAGATATLATGISHAIVAAYNCNCTSGTLNAEPIFSPASTSGNILVPAAAKVQWITAPQTINASTSLTLTVQVISNDSTQSSYPTGTVTFFDNGNTLNTVNVTASTGMASLALSAGQLASGAVHTLTATYNGNTSTTPYFGAATSSGINITVPAASSIAWTSGSQTVPAASTLTLTAAVSSADSTVSSVPTGSVTFTDLTTGATYGPVAVISNGTIGTATYSVSPNPLSAGIAHTLQAAYSGNSTAPNPFFAASNTSGNNVTIIVPAAAQVSWTTKSQSIASSSSVALAVVVTAVNSSLGIPSGGTVTFADLTTGNTLGTSNLSTSGTATLTVGAATLGTGSSHKLTAAYNGNTGSSPYFASASTEANASSTDPTISINANSSTSWSTASAVALPTSTLTLAATVASADGTVNSIPTGAVTFTDLTTGATYGPATVISNGTTGTATYSASPNPLSASIAHTLQAAYGGNSNALYPLFATSNTAGNNIVITVPAASKVSWTTQPQSISSSASLTLNVTVAPTDSTVASTPQGTVTFTDSTTGNSLGTTSVTSAGGASLTLAAGTLASGVVHNLVATYGGSTSAPYFSASPASAALQITVSVASKVTWVTAAQTVLTGTSLTLTAAVASNDNTVSAIPTGTMTFIDASEGNTVLGTATVQANGQASITVSAGTALVAGATAALQTGMTHNIQAVYTCCAAGATTVFANSTSASLAIFTPANSAINWVNVPATQTIDLTGTVLLGVKVTSADPTVTSIPTGTVAFDDISTGTTVLTTATLTASGTAQVTIPAGALAVGTHTLQAVYSGSAIYASSATSTITIVVTAKIHTTVILTANKSVVEPDGTVIFTATVIPDSQSLLEPYPTGTVEFLNGITLIGSATLSELGVSDESVATLAVSESSALPPGADTVTAVYLGDTYYAAATSLPVTVVIQDFSITASGTNPPENLTIVQGASGSASYIVNSLGGFAGVVQVVCSVPAQDYMTCTASPQQLTPPGTITFTVSTFTTGGATTTPITISANRKQIWPRAVGGTALALLGFFLLPFGKRARSFIRRTAGEQGKRFLILLLLLAGVGSTGMGCTSTSLNTSVTSTGTPLGVATLAITATSYVDNVVVSHSTYLTVNVVLGGS
jgi:hypothetical protein